MVIYFSQNRFRKLRGYTVNLGPHHAQRERSRFSWLCPQRFKLQCCTAISHTLTTYITTSNSYPMVQVAHASPIPTTQLVEGTTVLPHASTVTKTSLTQSGHTADRCV